MSGRYDDIKHLTRPQYDDFPPMSAEDRAAQFSSFDALVGYGDAVAETARFTDSRLELTDDELGDLNQSLNRIIDALGDNIQPEICVTYFVPDSKKSGGIYTDKTGSVRTFDEYSGELVFTDKSRISIRDILRIELL